MPVLTLAQLISASTGLAGGRNDWAPSEVSMWVNLAYEQVSQAAGSHHKSLESLYQSSTTSGGYRMALPASFDAPLALTLYQRSNSTATTSQNTVIYPLAQRDAAYVDTHWNQDDGGIPTDFIWYGSWLEFYPSPNSAYSIQLRYQMRQSELTLSTSTPNLAPQWHQALLYRSAALLEASRSNPNGESVNDIRYQNYVRTLETDLAKAQKDRRSMNIRFGMGRTAMGTMDRLD